MSEKIKLITINVQFINFIFIGPCIITYKFLNVTNEMQLLKTLLSSLFYMVWALLAHHQELTKTVHAAYSDGMQKLVNLI